MNSSLRLFTVCHKPFFTPAHDYLQRVWVGNNRDQRSSGDLADDSGENISQLNEYFCELTVLYWVWKNVGFNDRDVWGLCHYRRFFTDKSRPFSFSHFPMNRKATEEEISKYVHANLAETILKKMQDADVLLTYPVNVSLKRKVHISIYNQYITEHSKDEWDLLEAVIAEKYPAYLPSLKALGSQTKMSIANMMIARTEIWNQYLPWLFDLSFEMHRRIKYTDNVYQRRAIGFIGERLMNLYVLHNNLKPSYMQLVVFDK